MMMFLSSNKQIMIFHLLEVVKHENEILSLEMNKCI